MGRPKGSGVGYVGPITVRLEHDVYQALEMWRESNDMTQAEAVRRLLNFALEEEKVLKKIAPDVQERQEALLRARSELHRAVNIAWEKVTKE
jgi:hypothetical protein